MQMQHLLSSRDKKPLIVLLILLLLLEIGSLENALQKKFCVALIGQHMGIIQSFPFQKGLALITGKDSTEFLCIGT